MDHLYEDRYKRVYAAGARFWEAPLPTEELVNFIGKWVPPKRKVIDFGCGEGRDSIFLARSGYDVTGVDIAPSAINRAIEWADKLLDEFTSGYLDIKIKILDDQSRRISLTAYGQENITLIKKLELKILSD